MIKHTDAKVYSPTQVLFPEISHQTFTYPGDEEALAAKIIEVDSGGVTGVNPARFDYKRIRPGLFGVK